MAADLTAYLNQIRSVTMDVTPGDVTAITLNRSTIRFTLRMMQSDDVTSDTAAITWTGVDSAAVGAHAMPVDAGVTMEVDTRRLNQPAAQRIVYISAGTASALAKIEQFG